MKQNRVKNLVLKGWLAAALLASGAASAAELLNSSYDVSRELFVALNPGFEQQWNQQHPNDKLTIKQSHAGSSKQALAILQGLRADVVTYNQVTDVQILHDRGQLIPADWQARLPNNSSPFYSTMAFLVRKDNPKGIHTWNDLVRDDVKLVFPNPKTSGNGRYTLFQRRTQRFVGNGADAALQLVEPQYRLIQRQPVENNHFIFAVNHRQRITIAGVFEADARWAAVGFGGH